MEMPPLNDEERAARAKILADRDERRQRRENGEPEPVNTDFKLPNPTDETGNPQNNPPSLEASEAEKAAREAALHDETATVVGGSGEDYAQQSVDVPTTQASVPAAGAEGGTDAPTSSEIDRMSKADLGKFLASRNVEVDVEGTKADDLKIMAKKQLK